MNSEFISTVFQEDIFSEYGKFPENDKHRLMYDAVQEIINHDYFDEKHLKLSDNAISVLHSLLFRNDGLKKFIFDKNFEVKCKFIVYEFVSIDDVIKICKYCAKNKNCKKLNEYEKIESKRNIITSMENYCSLCNNRLYVFKMLN